MLAAKLGAAASSLPDDASPTRLQLGSNVLKLAFALGWQVRLVCFVFLL